MASIRKRGETFTITAYMGYDESGKQRKKTTTFRPPDGVTPGKAEKLARAYAITWEEKIKGYVALDENRTFSELAEWYYSTIAPQTLKPNVLASYKKFIFDHIVPVIGRVKLKNISPAMLDSLFIDLQKRGNMVQKYRLKNKDLFDGISRKELIEKSGLNHYTLYKVFQEKPVRHDTAQKVAAALSMNLDKVFDNVTEKKGLSGTTVNKLKMNLSAIFTSAVKKEIMQRNPCILATSPKKDTPPAAFLDESQCRKLLDLVSKQDDFQFEVMINLFLASGIRAGELSALYWEDIDLNTGVMFIRHTVVSGMNGYIRQEPKTPDSIRRIILPQYIIGLLQKHKFSQAVQKSIIGDTWKNENLVFTNKSGNFLHHCNINAQLKKLIAGTDLPQNLHLHSLRHTYASLLINSDVTARVIADRLGHKTTRTTLDTYSHIFAETETKAMQAIDMALFHKDD